MKRTVYVVFLVLFFTVCIEANSFYITNEDDFAEFARNVSKGSLQYDVFQLMADLHFTQLQQSLPVGQTGSNCRAFSGVFEGNNYTINGLTVNTGDAALFCNLRHATIQNLIIGETCSFSGMSSASIALSVTGDVTLRNIVNKANVSGALFVGGFIAEINSSDFKSVVIEDCMNYGIISGKNPKADSSFGGVVGRIASNRDCVITISNTINRGAIMGQDNVGGFIGSIENGNNNLTLSVANSKNVGDCSTQVNKNSFMEVSGLVGFIFDNIDLTIIINSFVNDGSITCKSGSHAFSSGLIGYTEKNPNINLTICDCTNNGKITAVGGEYAYNGGLISVFVNGNNNSVLNMINNVNNGIIDCENTPQSVVGGIISAIHSNYGMILKMSNNTNNANIIIINVWAIGGLIGSIKDSSFIIDLGKNNGLLESSSAVITGMGGIIGYAESSNQRTLVLKNCENKGNITSTSASNYMCCGLVVINDGAGLVINNGINKGSISCTKAFGISNLLSNANSIVSMGSVSGSLTDKFWMSNCSHFHESLFCFVECNGDKCNDCLSAVEDVKSIKRDGSFYFVVDNGARVDWLLNNVSVKKRYEHGWDAMLDIVSYTIYFGDPLNQVVEVNIPGLSIRSMNLSIEGLKNSHWFDGTADQYKNNSSEFDETTPVLRDFSLSAYYLISVSDCLRYVKRGTELGRVDCFDDNTFRDKILTENNRIIDERVVVDHDMKIDVRETTTVEIVFEDSGNVLDDYRMLFDAFVALKSITVETRDDGMVVVRVTIAEEDAASLVNTISECL